MERVTHTLLPVFNKDSRVLILGTMPSPKSRELGFYYMHPKNRFWRVLCAVLGEELPDTVLKRRDLLFKHGIALWDVLASCEIKGASDSSIRSPLPNDFEPLFMAANIKAVFTTGQTAYRLYQKLCAQKTGKEAILLPSPSPANCAVREEALIEAYRKILPYLHQ